MPANTVPKPPLPGERTTFELLLDELRIIRERVDEACQTTKEVKQTCQRIATEQVRTSHRLNKIEDKLGIPQN